MTLCSKVFNSYTALTYRSFVCFIDLPLQPQIWENEHCDITSIWAQLPQLVLAHMR